MSAPLRPFLCDSNGFSNKLNTILGVPPVTEVTVDVHRADSPSQDNSSLLVYDWDESGSTVEDLSATPALDYSTPVQNRKRRKTSKEPLPVLFKKSKPHGAELSAEDSIMREVQRAYLGSAKVLTAHLKLGPQLRELRESFISDLMVQMKECPGHMYQPLCVIIDTLDDASLFRESNANGFHYKVIGGCHNFTAAKRLSEVDPAEEVFKHRMCCIYKDNLSKEAVMWLANRHNTVGEYRHSMSLTEKIQLCRQMFQDSGMSQENKQWQAGVSTIFGRDHSKGIVKLLCKLAEMDTTTYNLLQQMLNMFGDGKLKNQKMSTKDLVRGPDMKPYVLAELPVLPPVASQRLLQSLINAEITIAEFQKEAKVLQKLQTVQQMFLDLMGLTNWQEATQLFPLHTTREMLEHFTTLSLRRIPEKLKMFCRRLRAHAEGGTSEAFEGAMGSIGISIECDALDMSEDMLGRDCPDFPGADLVILDMPKEWEKAEIKSFLNAMTSININKQLEHFTVVILCSTQSVADVSQGVRETQHFEEPMPAFFVVPCGNQSQNLSSCVNGMVLARRKAATSLHEKIVWKDGTSDNYLITEVDLLFHHEGVIVDEGQKPLGLYQELVLALTIPGQWVLDVCSGTGTGMIAALREGRNVLAVDKEKQMMALMEMRVSKEVGRRADQSGTGEEGEVEEGEDDGENEETE